MTISSASVIFIKFEFNERAVCQEGFIEFQKE